MRTLLEQELHEKITKVEEIEIDQKFIDDHLGKRQVTNIHPDFYFDPASLLREDTIDLWKVFKDIFTSDDETLLSRLDPVRRDKFLPVLGSIRKGGRKDMKIVLVRKDYIPFCPTQTFASTEKVKILAIGGVLDDPTAAVVKILGKYYIIDGQHRFLAWMFHPDDCPTQVFLLDLDTFI